MESELDRRLKHWGLDGCQYGAKHGTLFHGPLQKCLFYSGKWRNVCLACGKVEMEDGWRKL